MHVLVVFGSIDDSLQTKEKTISSSVICLQSQLGITDIQYRSYHRWILPFEISTYLLTH